MVGKCYDSVEEEALSSPKLVSVSSAMKRYSKFSSFCFVKFLLYLLKVFFCQVVEHRPEAQGMPELGVCVCVLAAQFINLSSLKKFKETSTKKEEDGSIRTTGFYFGSFSNIQRSQKPGTTLSVCVRSLYRSRFTFVCHRRFDLVASHFSVAKPTRPCPRIACSSTFVARTFSCFQLAFPSL